MTSLRVAIDQPARLTRALDSSLLSLREARRALDHVRAWCGSFAPPRREEVGGDGFELALRVGLVRRSGKGART
ncbi:hypothetical protein [Streptomyces sp. ISL-94]|uniref:hypothetical protein n=1 Tax=Streptomyces sp. ISL-94 TaxID=2819190 RepID=UPI001BE74944|nr:hypothetical protein [Streptomyces sp. ISL-94]MBT2482896.1 hypothetical protein [Streptomyces sp. ISL-94]